jgi:hypothetical protein
VVLRSASETQPRIPRSPRRKPFVLGRATRGLGWLATSTFPPPGNLHHLSRPRCTPLCCRTPHPAFRTVISSPNHRR